MYEQGGTVPGTFLPKLPLNCLGPCRSSAGSFYPNRPALRPTTLCAGGITRAEITRLDRDRVYRRVQDNRRATTTGCTVAKTNNGGTATRCAFNSVSRCLLHEVAREIRLEERQSGEKCEASSHKSARRAPANLHNPFSSASSPRSLHAAPLLARRERASRKTAQAASPPIFIWATQGEGARTLSRSVALERASPRSRSVFRPVHVFANVRGS